MRSAPRIKLVFAALLLVISVFAVSIALQEEALGLSFKLSISPSTLSKPGKVKVKVTLVNSGQKDLNIPISLFDPDDNPVTKFFDGGTLSKIKVGEAKTWSGEYSVKQEHLDKGKLVYYVKYPMVDENGASSNITLPAEADIAYVKENVSLKVDRVHSPEVFRRGDDVKVTYTFRNEGNVSLTNISITEHSSIASKPQTIKEIKPGESKKIEFLKKAARQDLKSHPEIKYKVQGESKFKRTNLDLLLIPIAKPNLKISLSADNTSVTIGENVVLTLTMVNEGNVSYSGVSIKDKKLGELFTGLDIPAKQTVVKTAEVQMNKTQTFQFEVNLKDNTGKAQTEKSNSLKVSAYDPAKMTRIAIDISSDRENISTQPGSIFFKIVVTNNSNFDVSKLRVTYRGKTIFTIPKLKPSESNTFEREFSLSQAGKVRFDVKVEDYLKNTVTFESNTLEIGYSPVVPTPTLEPIVTLAPLQLHTDIPASMGVSKGGSLSQSLKTLSNVFVTLFGVSALLFLASTVVRVIKKSHPLDSSNQVNVKHSFLDESTYLNNEAEAAKEAKEGEDVEPSYEKEAFQRANPLEESKESEAVQPETDDISESDMIEKIEK